MTQNPYLSVPARCFWKQAVAQKSLFDIDLEWDPKYRIGPKMKIATFGSCFAQHFGRALKQRNMNWFDAEPAIPAISDTLATAYGYRTFSARTANIYTTSLLLQWTKWALEHENPPQEVWHSGNLILDPFRPRIEPQGFASVSEMRRLRQQTIVAFRKCITDASVFVFTLGLTESWFNTQQGYEYPMCPGTAGGEFNPDQHRFRNQSFDEVRAALQQSIQLMRDVNPGLRFLLTVSPVPLTATYSNRHVITATMESKSILRAVAGELSQDNPLIDYFPSYEIINSPAFRSVFFEPNMRSVGARGVEFVMQTFFRGLETKYGLNTDAAAPSQSRIDLQCEEAALAAYGDAE